MKPFSILVSVLVGLFILSACGPTVGKAVGETSKDSTGANQLSSPEINTPHPSDTPIVDTATLLPTNTPLPTVTPKPTQVSAPIDTPKPLLPDTKTVLENSKVVMDRLSSYRYKGTMVISEPVSGFELPLNFDAVVQPPDKLSEKLSFEMMGMLLEGEERKVQDRYFSLEPMEEAWNEVTSYDGPDFATIWSGSGEEDSLFELPLSGTPEIEGYADKEAYLIEFDLIESLGDPSLANNFLSFFDFDATEDSLDDMEKFRITYWIDSSTFYLLKLELEIAMRDDTMLSGMMETDGELLQIFLDVNLFDFDKAIDPILIPENIVLNAPASPAPAPAPAMPVEAQEIETLAPLTSYPSELRVEGHFSLDGTYNLKWDGDQLQTYNGMPQWINSDCGIAFGCFIYYHRPVPSSIRNGKNLADGVWALSDAVPSNMWVMNAYYDNIGYPWELNRPGWTLTFGTSFIEDELTVEAFYWLDDTVKASPELGLKDFYAEGEKLMAEGNYSKAIESLTKYIEMYPDSGAGYQKRGESFFAMQQYVSAIGNLDRAIELGMQEPKIYGMLGKSFLELEEYEIAIDKFEILQFMEPKNPLPYHYMGICYMELKRYKKAIHSWEILASIREKRKDFNGHAYRNLGIAYMRLGLSSAAIKYFDQVLAIEPGSDALGIKKDILSGAVETSDPEEASKIAKSLSTSKPEVLEVKHKNNQTYSGYYFLEGTYNNAPVWINYGCSAAGAYGDELGHIWGCFIFKWGAVDEWVLQPLPPSKEWLADATVNGTSPWEGVVTEGLDFIRIPDLIPVSKSN